MTTLVKCIGVDEPFFPMVVQAPSGILGQGDMTRDELIALLPKGEKLRKGHYRITDEGAFWLGTEYPSDLLK